MALIHGQALETLLQTMYHTATVEPETAMASNWAGVPLEGIIQSLEILPIPIRQLVLLQMEMEITSSATHPITMEQVALVM